MVSRRNYKIASRGGWMTFTNIGTGRKYRVPREQGLSLKHKMSKYKSLENFETALYRRTTAGKFESNLNAVENLHEALDRIGIDEKTASALERAIDELEPEQKNQFWERNSNFLNNVYDFYSQYVTDPFTAVYGRDVKPEDFEKYPSYIESVFPSIADPENRQVDTAGQREIVNRMWESLAQFGKYRSNYE